MGGNFNERVLYIIPQLEMILEPERRGTENFENVEPERKAKS